jgi:hypothetical protein
VFNGSDTVFNDLVSPLQSGKVGINTPTFDEANMSYYFEDKSPAATEQYTFVALQMPHGRKPNSNISCHIHGYQATTGTGNVTWELLYTWTNISATQAAATSLNKTFPVNGTASRNTLMDFGAINGNGKDLSSTFKARLRRTSAATSDTYAGNYYVDFFDCHYEQSTIGSRSEYS